MKPKLRKMPAPRNPFVAAAKFKKAGAHATTEKAKRRAAKSEVQKEWGGSSRVEHPAFNRMARIRSPLAPPIFQHPSIYKSVSPQAAFL